MLSDIEIKQAIDRGEIKITPFALESLGPSNYELHLGHKLLVPKKGQFIDLKDQGAHIEYDEIDLTEAGFVIEPKAFLLAQTLETLSMTNAIGAFMDGRTTLARLGLSIYQSSNFCQPSDKPHILTLEILNASENSIKIYPEIKIGKLVFFRAQIPNSQGYDGKYVGQQQTTGARI
jgi:dCTP deaminase